jgi:hypothetical protein
VRWSFSAFLVGAATLSAQEAPPRTDAPSSFPSRSIAPASRQAYPPDREPEPPPVEATLTRVDYDLRVAGESATGEVLMTIDVLKDGWVSVPIPSGLLVREARLDGKPVFLVEAPAPHVLLSKTGAPCCRSTWRSRSLRPPGANRSRFPRRLRP